MKYNWSIGNDKELLYWVKRLSIEYSYTDSQNSWSYYCSYPQEKYKIILVCSILLWSRARRSLSDLELSDLLSRIREIRQSLDSCPTRKLLIKNNFIYINFPAIIFNSDLSSCDEDGICCYPWQQASSASLN